MSEIRITVKVWGETQQIVGSDKETILESSISAGLNPPFSCQTGACGACRAILTSGDIVMDERDALTDEEIEAGFILTCQAQPASEEITLDYDV